MKNQISTRNNWLPIAAVTLLAMATPTLRAATFGWSGSGTGPGSGANTAWQTVGNWTNNSGLPGSADFVWFGSAGSGTSIGFNFNGPPAAGSSNIGAIVLGAGSTVDRTIGNSSTTAGIATRFYLNGISGGLITNAVSGRTLTLAPYAGGSTVAMTNVLVNSGVIEAVGNVTISANIIEAGTGKGITKTANGILTLSGTNAFTGKTIVNAGILAINREESLGANPGAPTADQLTLNGGILRNTTGVTIDDANRGITLGAGGGYFDVNSGTMTVSRPIVGAGHLHKIATANQLTLNSIANTYSGKTFATNGTLQIINDLSLGNVPGSYVADQLVLDGVIFLNNNTSYAIAANRGITIVNGVGFTVGWTRPCDVNSVISGPGTLTARSDVTPGPLRLNAANAFTNNVIVANSTAGTSWALLEVNGSLAGGGGRVYVTTNGFLSGSGTINRPVQATNGAVLNGGVIGAAGTLTINDTLSLTNAILSADLASVTTVGTGVNDLIQVNGNLNLIGQIRVQPTALSGTLANGTYRLINYTGTLIGGTNFLPDVAGYSVTFDTSTPGQINMTVGGSASTAYWRGTGGAVSTTPRWDVNQTTNWSVSGNPATYLQGQHVVFDDTGSYFLGLSAVSVQMFGLPADGLSILPASVTVDTTNNFTLTSGGGQVGKLSGPVTVTKRGSGIFAMGTGNGNFPSDYTGPTIVEAGILRATFERSFGATNGPTIATNGGTLDLNAQSIGPELVIASGAGVSNNGAVVNLGGSQLNALRHLQLSGDATVGGVNRWDVRNYTQNNGWPAATVTGGGYSLIKTGVNQVTFVDVGDTDLGDIAIRQGNLNFEISSTMGRSSSGYEVSVYPGATLGFWGSRVFNLKAIDLTNNARLFKDNGTTTNDGLVTLSGGTAIIDVANNSGDIYQFRNVLSGPGGLAKIGVGNLVLSGTNTYSGPTVVSNGTLTLQTNVSIANSTLLDVKSGAFLNASTMPSPLTIGSGRTLTGGGTIVGRVTADTGANVAPGTSPGTLFVSSNLVLNNANLTFELNTATNEGAGINDAIMARDLTLSGVNALNIVPLTPLTLQPYTLFRSTNAVVGSAANLSIGGGSRYTWTPDFSVANLVRITPAGAPASLEWAGGFAGSETLWDVNTTDNWTNGAALDKFFQGDSVLFSDLSTYTNVSLVGSLTPGNITVNSTYPVSFGGSGQIKTLGQFAKQNTGSLIISNNNPEWNGGVTITGGALQIGGGGTSGSIGLNTLITNNATLAHSRSDSNGLVNVIRGSGSLVKNGSGTLSVLGGNAFSGAVVVNEGVLRVANATALGGSNNSVTVNNGGQIDFAGTSQSAANQRYNYSIAGYGPDGRGAIIDSGASVSGNSGVSNLTLTADAAIGAHGTDGDGGRFDIGGTGWGRLDGGGYRLVKLGAGRIPVRTSNTVNLLDLVISNGMIYAESFDNNLGTNITVYPGGVIGMYSPAGVRRTNNAVIKLEGGTLTGGGATVDVCSNYWTMPVYVNQPSYLHAGLLSANAHTMLAHNIVGSQPLVVIGNNNRRFDILTNNDATFSGNWLINGGAIIRTVDNGTLGSGTVTNLGTIEWFNTNSYSHSQTLTAPFGNGTFRHTFGAGALTFSGSVAQNSLVVQNGNPANPMTFASGANVQAGTVSIGITNFGPALGSAALNIDAGATFRVGNLFLGDQNTQTGVVVQAGGDVIITNQFRLSHYPNNVSTYTLNGGTLISSLDPAVNPSGGSEQVGGFYIGIDGVGIFTQNGGAVSTPNLVLDNRGSSVLGTTTNTYTLNGGTLTIGRWGILSPVSTYQINLNGGTLAASSNWASALRMAVTNTAAIDPAGNTITLNGVLYGSGAVAKVGSGTLLLNATNTFAGGLAVTNGTVGGNGVVASATVIETGGTLSPGTSVGIFSVSNSVTLLGTTFMEISRSGATLTNDRLISASGTVQFGGALVVTNVGQALLGGEVFNLFDWAAASGTFAAVTLPPLAPNLSWNTTQLYVDGTIRVVGTPSILTGPANVTAYVGDIARFNASVDGFGPLTNQWSKDGIDILGANGTNLALTNITMASAGTYTFCSSNSYGGNCASATLTVLNVTNITNGLIAWWTLDEFDTVNNRALDSTVNTQHVGGIGIQASNVIAGVRSNAMNFNGAASNFLARITNGTDVLPAYQYPAASVGIWVRGSHTVQNDRRVYIEGSTNNNNPLWGFGTHSTMGGGPQVDIYVRNDNGSNPINHQRGRLAAFDGNWHHITFVDNNGNISLFVDGQWDTNINYARGTMTLNSIALAGLLRATYGSGYIGDLDDVMVWRRALSSNEAAQVYRNALEGPPVITVQPVAQSAECSSNVTFSVTATSLDAIGYQWYLGASPVANATNSSLTFTAGLALAGNYSVVLTNIAGATTSAVVALTVSDTIAPVVGVSNITRFLTGASVTIAASDVFDPLTSSDACSGTVTLLGAAPLSFTCPGTHSITVTAHDGNLNTNTAIATVTIVDPAATNLLAFEPFACYTEGSLVGQNYTGTGFDSGGWFTGAGDLRVTNTASLRYASGAWVLAAEGGRASTPAAGFNTAFAAMNTNTSGAFSNLVDGGRIGGPNASGTLYFSFLARNASGSLDGTDDFAGFELFDDGSEVLGIGNNWGAWAYSLFGISGDVDLTNNAGNFFSMDATVHLFVARIDYASGGNDTVTVWMDPDISVSEGSQGNLYRRTFTGNAAFNRIALRSGSNNNDNNWDYDEIRFGSSWASVTPSGVAITAQPASVAQQCGGSTGVSVTAASLGSLEYQWYRNGSPVSAATNDSLTISPLSTNNAGGYAVVISSRFGSVTSSVATVTVTNTPVLISPAGALAVGTESNACGSMVLAGGSSYRWEINDATGGAGTGWDLLNVTGDITVEATSGNPFVVDLWSLNGVTPGLAANWNNDTTNLYTVATPSGAVNGFAANKFTLNDANFSNDLAGGVFSIEEGSLKLKFMPNHAPTALDWTNNRAPGLSIKIKITNLLAQAASDVDGDGVAFVGVGSSTNGAAISTNGTYIFYSSTNNLTEAIAFTVRDVRSYRAGDTVRTATAYLYITAEAPAGTNGNAVDISFTNGVVGMRFAGIPGYAYEIQRATNLTPPVAWTTLHSTNAPTEGLFDFIDLTPPVGSAYYRTAQP
jgi:autotransporter-associated beta strand protein